VIESPLGPLTITASDAGVRTISWPGESPRRLAADPAVERPEHPVVRLAVAQLEEYFSGDRRTFDVPLDPEGTEFQLAAWEVLRSIPYGSTVSYAEQADRLGDRNKARAVGAANGRNPIPIIVPCHRVVGASGSLTGFAGGLETKAWLLAHEQRHTGDRLPI
jgi:methylated-DNA-[protein]-cysteine S-methyltransferase